MPKQCNVPECLNNVWGKGFCQRHQYLRTDKKPNKPLRQTISIKRQSDATQKRKAIQSQQDKEFYLSIIEELDALFLELLSQPTDEEIECPECKGLGIIGTSTGSNHWRGTDYDCDVCHGIGRIKLYCGNTAPSVAEQPSPSGGEEIELSTDQRQALFNYFDSEHGIALLDGDFNEIEHIIKLNKVTGGK